MTRTDPNLPYPRSFHNLMVDRHGYTFTPDSPYEAAIYRAAHGARFVRPGETLPTPDPEPQPAAAPEPLTNPGPLTALWAKSPRLTKPWGRSL